MSNETTKPKVPETKVKDPNFIRFTPVQMKYLLEIVKSHQEKFNDAVGLVYEELGIAERISKAELGTYKLRKDCSGVDVLPIKPTGSNEK